MLRSSVKLQGAFQSRPLTVLVVQATHAEPSVQHAVLALSSIHRAQVNRSDDDRFAIQQYGKAISSLRLLPNSIHSKRTTLIAAMYFVNMEFLRGHYAAGLMHVKHALSLLQDNIPSTYIDGWLVTIFIRTLVSAKLFGQLPEISCQPFVIAGLRPELDTFRSVHHARRTLDNIMLKMFDLKQQGCDSWYNRQELALELYVWNEIHARTMLLHHEILDWFAYRLLHIYYHVAWVLVDGSAKCDPFRSIIDESLDIARIRFMDLAKSYHDPEPYSPNHISDIGWIPPLYFTAIHCRDYRIRHKATRMIQSTHHKEGIWDSALASAVASKIVELEEDGFYDFLELGDLPISSIEQEVPSLPENYRLSNINITLPDNPTGQLLLSCYHERKQTSITCTYHPSTEHWTKTTTTTTKSHHSNFCPTKPSLIPHNFSATPLSTAQLGALQT